MTTPIITASPNNEMTVLGAILSSPENTKVGLKLVHEEDFHDLKHRIILSTIRKVFLQKKGIDISLLINGLKSEENLDYVGGPDYLISLAQCVGPSVYIEAEIEDLKKFTKKREIAALLISMKSDLEKGVDESKIIEKAKEKLGDIERKTLSVNKIPIVPMSDRIAFHKAMLEKCRGKKYLGLCVKSITEFNDKMLGLRKLILLAAAPNVGKTALTIQLGIEVLLEHPDACLVYVSLEMEKEEIMTRILLYLSGLDHDTYVLGLSQGEGKDGYQNFFTQEEHRKIDEATEKLKRLGIGFKYLMQAIILVLKVSSNMWNGLRQKRRGLA